MITPVEYKFLKSLRKGCNLRKVVNNVYPFRQTPEINAFVKEFLKARIPSDEEPDTIEIGLWYFSSVGMHTDSLHTEKYGTLILPVKGRGELSQLEKDSGRIEDSSFNDDALYIRPIVLNDTQPHSFISKTKVCYAILADVKMSQLEYLKNN